MNKKRKKETKLIDEYVTKRSKQKVKCEWETEKREKAYWRGCDEETNDKRWKVKCEWETEKKEKWKKRKEAYYEMWQREVKKI